MADSTKRPPWAISDIREYLAGASPPGVLNERDRKGSTLVSYAALASAETSERLTGLLSLLDPPQGEASQVDVLLNLMEQVAASQLRLEQRLDAIALKVGVPSAP